MYKQYIKQAWQLLKENRFYSLIYIAGTAFTITMVMLILTTYHIKTAGFSPEVNRHRMLFVSGAYAASRDHANHWMSAQLSLRMVKELYYSLETAEKVSAVIPFFPVIVSIPGSEDAFVQDRLSTDNTFWDIFRFQFIAGKPYGQADFDSGLKKVVLSERVARQLYNTVDIVGRTVEINKEPFTVCGVVKNIPTIAENAYAGLWVPYSATNESNSVYDGENILGPFIVYILADDKQSFDAIKQELDHKVAVFNGSTQEYEYKLLGQPDIQLEKYIRKNANMEINLSSEIKKYLLVIFFLLLIPVLNISGLIVSRMKRRRAELGLRKAFGASREVLIKQILIENFLPVLLGGVIGLLFSSLIIRMMSRFFLTSAYSASFVSELSTPAFYQLVNPVTFFYVFILCVVLNIASALVPAWRTTHISVVEALKNS